MTVQLEHDRVRTLGALTGIRFLAAAWVVLLHFQDQIYALAPAYAWAAPVIEAGYMGVDMFFVLSGFILAYNYSSHFSREITVGSVASFLWLRLARLWPVHFLTLNLFVVMLYIEEVVMGVDPVSSRTGVGPYLENLFLVQAWWGQSYSYNVPAWSVSAEWFAYLLFPIFCFVLFKRVKSVLAASLGLVACYVFLSGAWLAAYWFDVPLPLPSPLLRVVAGFFAGCLLFRVWEWTGGFRRPALWIGVTAITLMGAIVAIDGAHPLGVAFAPLFAVMIMGLADMEGLLATRLFVFGGEVSYSLYMTHSLVLPVIYRLVPIDAYAERSLAVRSAVLFITAMLVLGVAVATYWVVERPARRAIRGVLPRAKYVAPIS